MPPSIRDLLVKAVRKLSQEEQDQVLGALLSSRALEPGDLGQPGQPGQLGQLSRGTRLGSLTHPLSGWLPGLPVNLGPDLAAEPDSQLKVLPVRLPVSDYDRLRAFSRENGFSMAVIVRTLVERFLDERAAPLPPDPPDPPDPAAG